MLCRSTRISDVLVKANTLANATVEQFSSSLTREAGAAMKSFNIDVEEGVAVLAAFADQGVKGEIAGTSFSRILRLMTSAAVNNAEAYRELGISVFDAEGNIRNMADIVGMLEGALTSLSDEERVVALETLGFQARVQGVILPLLGTSSNIREFESALRSAGGTTQEVADKQMQSFFDQLTITWNRIKDVLLTIGEQLVPVLSVLNAMLQQTIGGVDETGEAFNHWSTFIAPALIAVVGTIGDALWGLKLIGKGVEVVFFAMGEVILDAMSGVVNTVTGAVRAVIRQLNRLPKVDIALPGLDILGTDDAREALHQLTEESKEELAALSAESFSDKLQKGYAEVTNRVKKENKAIVEDVRITTDKVVSDFARISKSEATGTVDKMFVQAFGEEGTTGGGTLGGTPFGQDPASAQLEQFALQQELAEENLVKLADIAEREIDLKSDTQERLLELQAGYNEQVRQLQIAQAQIILTSAEGMFGDLTEIAGNFAGEQSGIYKGLFALSKAFAIADATVKIAQGIAGAAALPFPANIPAMASVVAATTSIISSIQAVQLEFGGGKATGGPVGADKTFLVGEKGPELFSPGSSGVITPNNKLGGEVTVTVNNFTNAKAEVRETNGPDGREVEVIIQQAKNSIASDIKEGRGAVPRAMKSSFGLKRNGDK